ncbi:hypothetical protein [Solimonas sp. SE-A11]|uniref:hypothetical protein n=1 Tax=Solimonas sp. SE-A11 TaxID=3054954 RepID=UPI00259CE725|nr:hypothetical protein [Solimonas sp. SE-A11]MDM4771381.1 hypothetical protein [Solimonas sp. SE-A11]
MSVLLGLVLLLQGYAVSAAPRANLIKALDADMAMQMDMPCHGQKADAEKAGKPSCCNADCPDMTTCALGHIASAVSLTLEPPRGGIAEPDPLAVREIARTSTSLLRPPILSLG